MKQWSLALGCDEAGFASRSICEANSHPIHE